MFKTWSRSDARLVIGVSFGLILVVTATARPIRNTRCIEGDGCSDGGVDSRSQSPG